MKILNLKTYKLKLLHTKDQYNYLVDTCFTFTCAYNDSVLTTFDHQPYNRIELHHILYYGLRERYSTLNADYINTCISMSYETYKSQSKLKNCKTIPQSKFTSPRLTKHLYTLNLNSTTVSICTTNGRQTIPFKCRKDI